MQNEKPPEAPDPLMERLHDVALLMRMDVPAEQDPAALDQIVKREIDALVSPLSKNREKLIRVMRDPREPLDEEIKTWVATELKRSKDQVIDALPALDQIEELAPGLLEREFASKGFDLRRAEEILNGLNSDGKNVGGFPVRRDVRARTIFGASLRHVAFLLRSRKDGSIAEEKVDADLVTYCGKLRDLLSKKLVFKQNDPENGWYE